jgi:DNA repair exonuclease SbcCD ATPase subunit/predicted MPP superfamily phosphohydrolase
MTTKIIYLDSDLDEINTVFHISDIHIRKKSRHDEYMIVFDKFCTEVVSYVNRHKHDCIIVVSGDIMHDKTELVPESIDILKKFLVKLSNITEVVLIIGNHDTNIFNKESLDCITPIVSNMYTKHRLHLLNENAIYMYGNNGILFGVTTLWAKYVTSLNDNDIINVMEYASYNNISVPNKFIKIALYHGMIHGCTLDNGSKAFNNTINHDLLNVKESNITNGDTNSSYFNQTDFHDYDLVMLGDVHKHQYLNKAKTIAYAGSLIQQKRDEDLLEHGVIKWDIHKKRSEFIRIKNEFGMIQINVGCSKKDIENIKCRLISKYDNYELPKNLDIKIVYGSIESKKYFKTIHNSVFSKNNIVKISEVTDTTNVGGIATGLTIDSNMIETIMGTNIDRCEIKHNNNHNNIRKSSPLKLTDNDAVIKIMMDHLSRQNIVKNDINIDTNIVKNAIRDEITTILNSINYNYDSEVKNISLKSIEFNNMFIYVNDNKIDFSKFNEIVGLNAANYKGKSSFIDIILYSIYGECSRGKRYDILNIRRKKMDSRIILDVNGVEYIILRSSFINSATNRDLKEHVTVWEDGNNITADDRVKTHQMIEKKISSYEDMINNSFVLQKNGKSFVDLSDRDKKDLLCKMARFDIFDRIFVEAKSRHFSTGQSLGKLMKKLEHYDSYLVDNNDNTKNNIKKKNNKIINNTSIVKKPKKLNLNETVKKIENKMNDEMNNTIQKINSVENSITLLETELIETEKIKRRIENQLSGYSVRKRLFSDFNNEKKIFDAKCYQLINIINDSIDINLKLKTLKKDRSLDQLKHEYDKIKVDNVNEIERINMCIENNLKHMNVIDGNNTDSISCLEKSLKEIQTKLELTEKNINTMINNRNELQKRLANNELLYDQIDIINQTYQKKNRLNNYIADVKKIDTENNDQIKKENIMLQELENHEYDPNCMKCMKNPITKNILRINDSIKNYEANLISNHELLNSLLLELYQYDNMMFNGLNLDDAFVFISNMVNEKQNMLLQIERIDNTIKLLQKDSIILQAKKDKINTLFNQTIQNKEIEEKLQNLKKDLSNIREITITDYEQVTDIYNQLDFINSDIKTLLVTLNEMAEKRCYNLKFYKDYVIDTIELSYQENHIKTLEHKIESTKKLVNIKRQKVNTLNTKKIKLEFDLIKFEEIREEIESVEQRKTVLEYIKKALDKNGLVDTLLSKNIIPYLQNNINNILADVGHYQIDIQYKNQSVNIYKRLSEDDNEENRGLSVIMSSGYEAYLLDLVFRLALVQINNHIKTNFLLIDEGFNTCDPDNKNNIKELLEFMRAYYSWILIISHDAYIKSFYDMSITINSVKDGSQIKYIN